MALNSQPKTRAERTFHLGRSERVGPLSPFARLVPEVIDFQLFHISPISMGNESLARISNFESMKSRAFLEPRVCVVPSMETG